MFTSLLRYFGIVDRTAEHDTFEPIYGLPKQALDEWLSRNPRLKRDYLRELSARSRRSPANCYAP